MLCYYNDVHKSVSECVGIPTCTCTCRSTVDLDLDLTWCKCGYLILSFLVRFWLSSPSIYIICVLGDVTWIFRCKQGAGVHVPSVRWLSVWTDDDDKKAKKICRIFRVFTIVFLYILFFFINLSCGWELASTNMYAVSTLTSIRS